MFRTTRSVSPPSPPCLSNTAVAAGMDIPVNSIAGPYPGEFQIGLHTTDVQTTQHILEVDHEDGMIVGKSDSSVQWLWYVQPARDCHEQNAEAYTGKDGCVYIRTVRLIKKHEHVLIWYRDDFARVTGIPVLTIHNIKGKQQYVCNKCEKSYVYPNTLKAHMRFRCPESRSEILRLLHEVPRPEVPFCMSLSPSGCAECADIYRARVQSVRRSLHQNLTSDRFSVSCFHENNCIPSKSTSFFQGLQSPYMYNNVCRCSPNVDIAKVDVSLQYSSGQRSRVQIEPFSTNYIQTPGVELTMSKNIPTSTIRCSVPNDCCCDLVSTSFPHRMRNYSPSSDQDTHNSQFRPFTRHHDSDILANKINDYPKKRFHLSLSLPSTIQTGATETMGGGYCIDENRKGHLCLYCGKFYSRKYGLKIHLRTHTGYKPLKCKFCFRPFGDPSNLNKHTRLHAEGDTPYRCEFCGKILVRRRDLQRHIKSRHPSNTCEETDSFIKEESPSRAENVEEHADDIN